MESEPFPDMTRDISWLSEVPADELRRIIDALCRVHRFVSLVVDLDTLLERIMEEGKEIAQAEACSLMLYDADSDELYFRVALGESGDQQALKREVRLKRGEGIAGMAASTRQPVNVPDAQTHPQFYRLADQKTRFKTHSLLAVPLIDQEHLVGVLEMVNKRHGGPFSDADSRIMSVFASVAATAIKHAQLIKENIRSERLAAIGQAVAGLSHHTKNIITGMDGCVDLIEENLEKSDLDTLRQCWPVFRRCCVHISEFVEDMLAFSTPRAPIREACRIQDLVTEAYNTFSVLMTHKNVGVTVDVDGLKGPAYIDRKGIYQCLLNLITNAADAVPPEGGRIRVTARTSPIGEVEIEVADNGPGVPKGIASRIFEPFVSTKGSAGTGLGLAVTRKIVLEHGGDITVGDSPEGGALFRIRLPQDEKPESGLGEPEWFPGEDDFGPANE
jgi:signal transduction histidine kinase